MDHFIGFDALIRLCLGRDKRIRIFGPPGFLRQVEGKLSGYTWNLVDEYIQNLHLIVHEVHPSRMFTCTYACRDRFHRKAPPCETPFTGILHREPSCTVRGVFLDHRTPCLAFSLQERFAVNIRKNALAALGLAPGPWLTRFKSAVYEEQPPETEFTVTPSEAGARGRARRFSLGALLEEIATVAPGQKITYITDAVGSLENKRKMIHLARGSDLLFIETCFLNRDRETARKKYHLTAAEAGEIAGCAGVKRLEVFHFSPRYSGQGERLRAEAAAAFERTFRKEACRN
jgi:ribonuclease Z